MMKPLVTIIMPTYNRRHLIKRAIDSCLNQTYENFELIICDDHSTDGTEEYIAELRKTDNRIIYCKTPLGHKGANAARNAGIRIAQGKYLCFLDSDDEFLKNGIADRVSVFEKNPGVGMVYGNALCQVPGKKIPWIYDEVPKTKKEARKFLLEELSLCCQVSIMLRTKVFDRIGFLNEEQKGWTDDGLVVAVGLQFPVVNCNQFVVMLHKTDDSMTSNKTNIYKGLSVLVEKYKKEIIREVSLTRYLLWQIRRFSAFCYAKETTVDSTEMSYIWKWLHHGSRRIWHKKFRHKFE